MAEKFSIPNNYEIKKMGSLMGIVRNDKKGSKWIWEPYYNMLLVAKTYGKILIAYREATNTENYLRISSYNRKEQLPINVYDVLFGENCLYVKTFNKSTGEIEWAYIKEDFSGLKYLGDFEIVNRGSNPFYIPIGVTELKIKTDDGEEKKLKLMSAEIVETPKKVEIPKPVEEPLTEYKLIINEDEKKIQLLGRNGRVVKESLAIGELEQYKELIMALIGGTDVLPVKTGDLLIEFLSHFEHFVHGMVLPILYTYEKDRATEKKSLDERLKDMISELNSGWFKWENKEFKVYIQGTIFLAMMKEKGKKITVAPYMLQPSNNILAPSEFEAMIKLFELNKYKSTRLRIDNIELSELITDEAEIADYESPYSVRQRMELAKNIKSYSYERIQEVSLNGHLETDGTKENTGEMEINLLVCENFKYLPKLKNKRVEACMVSTNITAIQIA